MNASDEAAEWFIAQRTGELSTEERERFMRWLGDSAANVREYLAIAELWGALPAAPSVQSTSSGSLTEALKSLTPIATLSSRVPSSLWGRDKGFRRTKLLRVAACAAAFIGAAAWFVLSHPNSNELTTGRGEQRSLELPDGSVLQLNAVSHVMVVYDAHLRRVELQEGEALFRVAKDPVRPFEVVTADTVVRALGTTFNVYHRGAGTRVAVVEGKVQVRSQAAPVALVANQTVRVGPDGQVVRAASVEARKVTAWTQRRLVFDEEPLARVVEEFNLYNVEQLAVEDEELASFRINGVFDADDPGALLAYLERVQGVVVRKKNNGIRLTRSGPH
jgi:transmembrane sensor